ncbi:M20 metallopeptidase family protein [Paenibacillus senegalensis]|uniref:M20 metallopeptidase family protein n=1 Tax=Paenibacillus senegalensis TaxID=1465766 RepID=UPI0002DAEDF4|nr:M20 family metallopeptidase [Paenibacillus senegalensis]
MIINEQLERIYPEMVSWRRYLHEHPELSFQEVNTARFIAEKLEQMGIEITRNVGGHGIVGRLKGEKAGPVVALRADMDALPIQDEKDCAYASKISGRMHACGHDGHIAGLLGAAYVLSRMKEHLHGSILFLFQPAEEVNPGGAERMVAEGALDGVDVIYGVHLWSQFPVGKVYSVTGPMMAAADEFLIEISGKGGHGGVPQESIDSILVGSQLVVNLQTIVSRNVDPTSAAVVSVGSFHSGSSFNVIADRCKLSGTVRTFDEQIRRRIEERIHEITAHTCAMHGAQYEWNYIRGYPAVVNDATETQRFFRVAADLFGNEQVERSPLSMAGEDFSYYLQSIPGCYMFVGAGNPDKGIVAPHHHPEFDIDERSILHAARLMIHLSLDYMNEAWQTRSLAQE